MVYIPKGGNPAEVSNYRPISILPLISKLCEKIVHTQLLEYLNLNNILNKKQHGFRPKHSTMTSLQELTDAIYNGIEEKSVTMVTYLDFAKAFDTINHLILCKKLGKIGLDEASVSWFKSYLSGRMQSVKVNGITSDPKQIICGVPQGSILGPLLFLIYINDLDTSLVYMNSQLYADDTALFCVYQQATADIVQRINADLANVANWCKKNKLSLNIKKTKYAIYGTRQRRRRHPNIVISIDGQTLLQTQQYRYLGMELDVDLNFKSHIKGLNKSVAYKSFLTAKLRTGLNQDATLDIIKTMILPVLDYGQLIYSAGCKTGLNRLDSILSRLLRLCYYRERNESIENLLTMAGLCPLIKRRDRALATAAYKYAQLPHHADTRGINTRLHDALLMKVSWPKSAKARQSVTHRVSHKWNSLPAPLRSKDSLLTFKKAYITEYP